jgi:hypothetical protein
VVGRALAFSDPDILALASHDFVPAAVDDWHHRRKRDADGEFFRAVAGQGPKKAGAPSRQGIYALTPDGELLAYTNAGQDVGVVKDHLAKALARWKSLPADRTRPGAVGVPDPGRPDPAHDLQPPDFGLVVKAYSRRLDPTPDGYRRGGDLTKPGDGRAMRDFLWLDPFDEARLLPDPPPRVGAVGRLPRYVIDRVIRLTLWDNTRGDGHPWARGHVKRADLVATVTAVNGDVTEVRLDGDADLRAPTRSYQPRLRGKLVIDRGGSSVAWWELAAVGPAWDAVHGDSVVGFALRKVDAVNPVDRLPPDALKLGLAEYFGKP